MEIKPAMVAIAAFVVITVIAAVLMPVLDDATATTDTYTNQGYYDLTYSDAGSATFEWDYQYPRTLIVGDESVTLPEPSGTERTIICGDSFLIGYSSNTNGERLRYYDATHALTANVASQSTLTMTCESGSYSITVGETTYTGTYTELFYIDSNGGYVMKDSSSPAYVKGDSKITAMEWTSVGSDVVGIRIDGSIDDGVSFSVFRGEGYTISNENVNSTADADHKDLYTISELSYTVSDGVNTKSKTYTSFFVPAEVTAEKATHLSDNEIGLMAAIPVLVILAIVVGVIAAIIGRRME